MAVECRQRRVQPGGAQIVQQQAHAHAALGGGQQLGQQQRAGDVAAPDVVLHIQRAFGRARQQHAGGKGVVRMGQQVYAAQARVRGEFGAQCPADQRFARGGQRQRHRGAAPGGRRQAAACQQQPGEQRQQRAGAGVWGGHRCHHRWPGVISARRSASVAADSSPMREATSRPCAS